MPCSKRWVTCPECSSTRFVTSMKAVKRCKECSRTDQWKAQRAAGLQRLVLLRRQRQQAETHKTCTKCQRTLPLTQEHFYKRNGLLTPRCKECHSAAVSRWTQANKARKAATDRVWARANPEKLKAGRDRQKERIRQEFLTAYGRRCSCCGEDDPLFLTLEHLNGDGKIHREKKGSKEGMLFDLRRQAWPKDRYALLCFNCNCGKARNDGRCPHEDQWAEMKRA